MEVFWNSKLPCLHVNFLFFSINMVYYAQDLHNSSQRFVRDKSRSFIKYDQSGIYLRALNFLGSLEKLFCSDFACFDVFSLIYLFSHIIHPNHSYSSHFPFPEISLPPPGCLTKRADFSGTNIVQQDTVRPGTHPSIQGRWDNPVGGK